MWHYFWLRFSIFEKMPTIICKTYFGKNDKNFFSFIQKSNCYLIIDFLFVRIYKFLYFLSFSLDQCSSIFLLWKTLNWKRGATTPELEVAGKMTLAVGENAKKHGTKHSHLFAQFLLHNMQIMNVRVLKLRFSTNSLIGV